MQQEERPRSRGHREKRQRTHSGETSSRKAKGRETMRSTSSSAADEKLVKDMAVILVNSSEDEYSKLDAMTQDKLLLQGAIDRAVETCTRRAQRETDPAGKRAFLQKLEAITRFSSRLLKTIGVLDDAVFDSGRFQTFLTAVAREEGAAHASHLSEEGKPMGLDYARLHAILARSALSVQSAGLVYGPHTVEPVVRDRTRASRKSDLEKGKGKQVRESDQAGAGLTTFPVQKVEKLFMSTLRSVGTCELYKFVTNPESLAETVENVFTLSFLIKENKIQVYSNDGDMWIRIVDGSAKNNGAPKNNQGFISMNSFVYEKIIRYYKIKKSLLPTRNMRVGDIDDTGDSDNNNNDDNDNFEDAALDL